MLSSSKSFLAVDFGAGSLKLAEFEITEAGALSLKNYGVKVLGLEGSQESKREATILRATQELLASRAFGAKNVNVCAPGFHVFSKFVKLPPVDQSKVTQIIQYEAQQNVPFPLEEVVWDYAALGLTLRSHPLALLRPLLVKRRLMSALELRDLPDGRMVRYCGIVTLRQQPETARNDLHQPGG